MTLKFTRKTRVHLLSRSQETQHFMEIMFSDLWSFLDFPDFLTTAFCLNCVPISPVAFANPAPHVLPHGNVL